MSAVWFRFRAELRARWLALLAVALLVGLAGGAALAALAGARRTDTAFDRLVEETDAWDVLVNPDRGSESGLDLADVAALPQVEAAGRVDGLLVGPANARSFADVYDFGNVFAGDGKVGYAFGRPKLLEGRMPRARRADEVLINTRVADQEGWEVGDRISLLALSAEEADRVQSGAYSFDEFTQLTRSGALGDVAAATVTGIGLFPDEIVVDEGFEVGQLLVPPEFLDRHRQTGVAYWGAVVRLRHGARDIPEFRAGVQARAPIDEKTGEPESIAFQTRPRTETKVERAVRPSVGALTVFAAVLALTGLLVVGQALARQALLDARDHDVLHALGTTRGQLFLSAMLRAAVIAVAGALLAVVVAVVASPLTPIGVARDAEPDPGIDIAWTMLGAGFLITVVVVLTLAAWPAWRSARVRGRDAAAARPSRVVSAMADVGLSVPAAAGVRMALEPGRGHTAVPVRTTIIGAGLAIATVVAAGVFASSLDHLVSTPRLFGWNWDTELSVEVPEDQAALGERVLDDVADVLDTSPHVARWGTIAVSDITLNGSSVPAVAIDQHRGAALPTVVEGRLPERAGEVALGRLTQRQIGASTGDRVVARMNEGGTSRLEVVGTVVLPGLGNYPGADKTSLGEGAVATRFQMRDLGPNFARDSLVIRFSEMATSRERDRVLGRVEDIASQLDADGLSTEGVRRPSDIVAYDRVRSTPLVLALVLAVLASATVAHALVSAVRRRRRDLAMLATLGLTRRQISSTVAWQSTTVGLLALVIGIPLGIIGGRWAWGLLADDLGTLSEPRVPVQAIVIGIPVVVLLCNAVAYVPGRVAARTKPAVVLRSE